MVLKGIVNDREEPVINLHLITSKGHAHFHPVIIDTGFNGNLSVPEKLAKRYGWTWIGNESYEIATGDVVEQKVFLGEIRWFGSSQQVYAVASHAEDILMGTRLLRQQRLNIDFRTRKLRIY
jgi:clan AA aspartic protease